MKKVRTSRGSALILSLWALLLLSAAVFAWVKIIEQDIAVSGDANSALDARALAESGVAIALHPRVTPFTPLLQNQLSPGHSYEVKIRGEAGKLNLNWLLQSSINPRSRSPAGAEKIEMLKDYLQQRGLTLQETETLINCMLDWIDPDNTPRENGAEDSENYHPPNRGRFVSLDEITQIKGSAPLTSLPNWRDDFTVNSPGPIDLQWASLAVLQVLPNVGDARAEQFLQDRRGADKTDYTRDDHLFANVAEALSFLGFVGETGRALAPFVTLNDPTMHITSVGHAGKVYRQIEVIARKVGAQPHILWWKE